MRALCYENPREPGNLLKVIRNRGLSTVTAFGAACLYKACIEDADLAGRSRAIARTVLDKPSEARLYRAATTYHASADDLRIGALARIVARLELVAPALALLANGHDAPCDIIRRHRRPASKDRPRTLTRPLSRKAPQRTP